MQQPINDETTPQPPHGLARHSPERRREIAALGGVRSSGGFRSMTPEQRREAGRKGGTIAHQRGRAHQWTREEAAAAGRKGGCQPRRSVCAKEVL